MSDWEDEGYDDEDWDDCLDEAEETETVECSHCGADVYEHAPNCPQCGEYLIAATPKFWDGKPIWYVVLAILGMLAVTLALLI